MAYGHTTVILEPYAQATVVLDHSGSATYADNVEFVVGDGASLSVFSLQNWAADAVHLSHQHALLGRDARYKSFTVSLGGERRAHRPVGVLRRAGRRRRAVRALLRRRRPAHRAPAARRPHPAELPQPRGLPRRAAGRGRARRLDRRRDHPGRGRGHRHVRANRNLVLTDGTRVDSVPNLEILTGEVAGAGHASASGRLDDQHLFYLQARGIPYDQARRMVVRGFLGQLVDKIDLTRAAGAGARAAIEQGSSTDELRQSLRARRRARRGRVRGRDRGHAGRGRRASARRSSRCATSAPTPRSRSARARSTTTRSSAGCTVRASTCAPASPPTRRPPSRFPHTE